MVVYIVTPFDLAGGLNPRHNRSTDFGQRFCASEESRSSRNASRMAGPGIPAPRKVAGSLGSLANHVY